MAYIIDPNKNTIYKSVRIGSNNITIIDDTKIVLDDAEGPVFEVLDNGNINVGGSGVNNTIKLNGGICFNFKKLTDNAIEYIITENDYMVEVASDTYNTIILPSAIGNAGCSYIISRGENTTNNNLVLQTQIGEDIDGREQSFLKYAGIHIKLLSNGEGRWYVI